jgi:multiple sugar transport system permease protein/arabinogalactan oligomer/maltooligosaccharide transport system permease protein
MMSVEERIDGWLDEDVSPRRAAGTYGVLFLYFGVLLFPVFYLIVATFLTQDALFSEGLVLFPTPEQFSLNNWAKVLSRPEFRQYAINSTIVATGTTILTLAVSIVGAYSISRYDYPGSQHLVIGFVSSQMLPRVLILIPFFTVVLTLGILDTYRGIILAHSVVTIPFTIWLLKGYFDDIPQALDEAAKLDGCSDLDVLFRVILPLSLPGLSVGFFYTFVLSWNDFLFVSMLSQSQETRTLPFALFLFQNSNVVDWGATLTAAVITMAPVIVLFALVQRYIIEGLATGGSKGL